MSTPYATDEDIALRASVDFSLICPYDQTITEGTDGAFLANDRWTLRSSSADFQARGLMPGHLVQIAENGPDGATFVVESAGPIDVRLRRKGLPGGIGEPPGPIAGRSGLSFRVVTLGPQVALAVDDLTRRFGISRPLDDPGELRDAVVLTVLHRQYLSSSREQGGRHDEFAAKAAIAKEALDELLARLTIRTASITGTPPTTRFNTRMSR